MGCRGFCSAEKAFIMVNITFAMYAGSALSTACRLYWDPSTYTWFRWMCRTEYIVTTAYVFSAGFYLTALVYLASTVIHPRRPNGLRTYIVGVLVLILSEIVYGIWFSFRMWNWWKYSPKAELARKGMDIMHDLKPVLLTLERHEEIAREVHAMLTEVEEKAPNNAYVIVVFLFFSMFLEFASIILAFKLQKKHKAVIADEEDDDSVKKEPPVGWRKNANLHMAMESGGKTSPNVALPLLGKKIVS